MAQSNVRVFRGSEIERVEDTHGFSEILRPSVSGAPEVAVSRFATFKGGGVPAHYHTTTSIAYLIRGKAAFLTGDGFGERHDMVPGDYVVVPSGVVHMEETDGDETAEFIVVRTGGGGETVYLEDEQP